MNQDNIKRATKFFIIICAIIAVIAVLGFYIRNIVIKEKLKSMQADLLLVQAKVEILKGKNSVAKDENPLRGMQLSKINSKIKISSIVAEYGITSEELEKYYLLLDSDLDVMELGSLKGKYDGSYIVNYDTYEVVYTAGYTNRKGLKCFKVSEMDKEPEVKNPAKTLEKNTQTTEQTTETPAENTNTQTPEATQTPAEATTTETTTVEAQPTTGETAVPEVQTNQAEEQSYGLKVKLNEIEKRIKNRNVENIENKENVENTENAE